MKVLLQRVSEASVTVEGKEISRIGRGFLLLVGATHTDTEQDVEWLANKVAGLRVFEDAEGKMNLGLADVGGEALVVSQFTLYGDASKGRRPAFINAARPEIAEPLVDKFSTLLQDLGIPTQKGVFGAMMQVQLINDGPVTMMIERP